MSPPSTGFLSARLLVRQLRLLYPPAARRDYRADARRRGTTRPLSEKLGEAGRTQGWVAAGDSTQNWLPWPDSESRHTAPPHPLHLRSHHRQAHAGAGVLVVVVQPFEHVEALLLPLLGYVPESAEGEEAKGAKGAVGSAWLDCFCLRCFRQWRLDIRRRRLGEDRLPAGKGNEPIATWLAGRDDHQDGVKVLILRHLGGALDRFEVERAFSVADPVSRARIVKPRAPQAQKQFHTEPEYRPRGGWAQVGCSPYIPPYLVAASGMEKKNVEPWPGCDSTQMVPPWRSTILLQMASPMPVPG